MSDRLLISSTARRAPRCRKSASVKVGFSDKTLFGSGYANIERMYSVWFLVGIAEKTLRSAANLKTRAIANHLNGTNGMSADLMILFFSRDQLKI